MVPADKLAVVGCRFGLAGLSSMVRTNAPEESKHKIEPETLFLLGHADAWLAPEVIVNLRAELEESGPNWGMNIYDAVRHGLANSDACKFGIDNFRYNNRSAERGWERSRSFFDRSFRKAFGIAVVDAHWC